MSNRRISAGILWFTSSGGDVTVILRDKDEILRVSSCNLGHRSLCRTLAEARENSSRLDLLLLGNEIIRATAAPAA